MSSLRVSGRRVLLALPLFTLLVSLPLSVGATGASAQEVDPLQARVRSELATFTDWLAANHVKGYIGEVGWPDAALGDHRRWNALAGDWYARADASNLWVTAWSTGEWWGTGYKLAAYEDRWPGVGVDSLNTQASVIEAHPSTWRYRRGVNASGGEFGAPVIAPTSGFSNVHPGVYDRDYHYDSQVTFDFLARRGIKLVRIPFRWERLQPRLGQALDPTELGRLKRVVARARSAGLEVILDMHNYGGYYLDDGTKGVRRAIGSERLPIARFAEVWGRISLNFKNDSGVVGYGLMNEPAAMPSGRFGTPARQWEAASQRALDRIRSTGDRKLVTVAGYNWSGVQNWDVHHPDAWIADPAGNFRYEAHHYWDRDNSGDYPDPYSAEVDDAAARGFGGGRVRIYLLPLGFWVPIGLHRARARRRSRDSAGART